MTAWWELCNGDEYRAAFVVHDGERLFVFEGGYGDDGGLPVAAGDVDLVVRFLGAQARTERSFCEVLESASDALICGELPPPAVANDTTRAIVSMPFSGRSEKHTRRRGHAGGVRSVNLKRRPRTAMTIIEETAKSKKKKPDGASSPPDAAAAASTPAPAEHVAEEIDTERICMSTFNVPHREPDLDLVESVREYGLIEPGIVRPIPEAVLTESDGTQRTVEYEIVVGERRWKACRAVGRPFLTFVRELPDAQVLDLQTEENLQRADLTPLQEAEVFQAHIVKLNREPAEIAKHVHRSERYVLQRLKLRELPAEGKEALSTGRIALMTAVEIACLREEDRADALALVTPSYAEGALPVSEARARIAQRFHLRMVNASFPPDDALLLSAAGACTTCPKRSGNQLALSIEGLTEDDRCLDRTCWDAKTTAQWERRKALAKAEGIEVIEGDKAARVLDTPWQKGLLDMDSTCEVPDPEEEKRAAELQAQLEEAVAKGDEARAEALQSELAALDEAPGRTWRWVLGGAVKPQAIGLQQPTYGTRAPKVVELVDERAAISAAKEKGLPLPEWMQRKLDEPPPAERSDSSGADERAKEQAKMKLATRAAELLRPLALTLVFAGLKTLRGPKLWLALLHAAIGDSFSPFELDPVMERRGWARTDAPAKVVMREAAKLDEAELIGLFVEILTSDYGGPLLLTFAKDVGIDMSKAKAEATRKAKAELEKKTSAAAEGAKGRKGKKGSSVSEAA
jgi:ParB/RepB/Spo0J family partition protein